MEKISKKSINKDNLQKSTKRVLNFYPIKNTLSKISCHGKPNGKEIRYMKSTYGINFVLSLLNKKEEPLVIKKFCDENSIKWKHVELEGANMGYFNNKHTQKIIVNALHDIYTILKNEKVIMFIHCAAGIHRTGTMIYCILRMFEESEESALKAIEYIRKETWENVGKDRINVSEKIIVPLLLKHIQNTRESGEMNQK